MRQSPPSLAATSISNRARTLYIPAPSVTVSLKSNLCARRAFDEYLSDRTEQPSLRFSMKGVA